MLSESLRGVIAQTLCRKIGGGRVAALEVLIVDRAISNLIREGKTFQIPSMMQVGKAVGMVSLNEALLDLVTKKLVAPDEAYAKAVDKPAFESALKRLGHMPPPSRRARRRSTPGRIVSSRFQASPRRSKISPYEIRISPDRDRRRFVDRLRPRRAGTGRRRLPRLPPPRHQPTACRRWTSRRRLRRRRPISNSV